MTSMASAFSAMSAAIRPMNSGRERTRTEAARSVILPLWSAGRSRGGREHGLRRRHLQAADSCFASVRRLQLEGAGCQFPDGQVQRRRHQTKHDAEIPYEAVGPRLVVDIAAEPDADEGADL